MKYLPLCPFRPNAMSRPIRGAWIEMSVPAWMYTSNGVAPHTGRVD